MSLYTDILSDRSSKPGIHQHQLGEAVSVWAWMQDSAEPQTVATAAKVFNTTPKLIRDALDEHPWCFWTGPDDNAELQTIEHDGE
jgi:hypothetical protein